MAKYTKYLGGESYTFTLNKEKRKRSKSRQQKTPNMDKHTTLLSRSVCLNYPGHLKNTWEKVPGKKERGGEVKWQRKCSSHQLSSSAPSYLLVSCAAGQGQKRGARKRRKKEKKRGKGSVNLLYSKAEESEGGKFTEGQMKLMVIYNNLKLTSHCH